MNHAMLDLETLGTRPGCSILSVGVVVFDPMTGEAKARREWGLLPNGTPEWDTVRWWQGTGKKMPFSDYPVSSAQMLEELGHFIRASHVDAIWANGANADFGWLRALPEGRMVPWTFRQERCFRTVAALYPHVPRPPAQHEHAVIADCLWQIELLHRIYKEAGWNT
jgi:hypothetical protein